ncbi:hypothetical protein NL108_018186 [Boleophthalmus pectinirostris]|nr:hypothetical protein NL108_018186 [Boleophthalmus pectinirostris]
MCRFLGFHSSVDPSIHFLPLIGAGSQGQQSKQGLPDFHHPRHVLQLLRGNPKTFPGQPRHSPSSVSWVFPGTSSRWDMPGTPSEGGVQEASGTDTRATSTGSSRRGGAAALLRAPPV